MPHPQAPIQSIQRISRRHPPRLYLPDDGQGALVPLGNQSDKPLHPVAGLRSHADHELVQQLLILIHAGCVTGRQAGFSHKSLGIL
jgi:hypothetical protein